MKGFLLFLIMAAIGAFVVVDHAKQTIHDAQLRTMQTIDDAQ